jgi:hypothetical protein
MGVFPCALTICDHDAMIYHLLDENGQVVPSETGRRPITRLARAGLAAIALALGAARSAHAQAEGNGRIEGVVFDSVHARPLAGVRVVAAGTGAQTNVRAEATSDSAGRYHIDSLAAGRYLVGFESALLDSLEIALPPREAVVPPLSAVTLDLAMPPAAKLRSALCRDATLAEGTGVVYGHVVHAETENPLAGGEIALQWRDLAFDRKKLRPLKSERAASVTIDRGGWYRACGIPTGAWVSMQVQVEGRFGPVLRTRIDDTLGIAIRHLSFSAPLTRDSSDSGDSAAVVLAPFTGTAVLTGIVRGAGGLPIESAEVRVRGARSSGMTDAQGSYTLRDLPAGTREFEVRRLGYAVAEASAELRSGATVRRDVQLQRIVNLDSIRIVATQSRYPEFSIHKKVAIGGTFLTSDDIMRRHLSRTSDYVRTAGGFLIDVSRGRSRVVSARGASLRPCPANVVIDGMDLGRMDLDAVSVDDVRPMDIGAIEIYRPGDIMPIEYAAGCGLIVIWTRR